MYVDEILSIYSTVLKAGGSNITPSRILQAYGIAAVWWLGSRFNSVLQNPV